MVIDTSALLAILQDEPERRRFNEAPYPPPSQGQAEAQHILPTRVEPSPNKTCKLKVVWSVAKPHIREAFRRRQLVSKEGVA